jgi:hypothetical protein
MGNIVSPNINAGIKGKIHASNMAVSWLFVNVDIKNPIATVAKTIVKVAIQRIIKLPRKGSSNHHSPRRITRI